MKVLCRKMFNIDDTKGKGKGAIALQDIPTGTLLQREQPIIQIPRHGIQRRSDEMEYIGEFG